MKDGSDNDITSNPTLSPYFTYTNREWDAESGLYYYRARYYDSSSGRFIQSDPHPGALISPISYINKYIYGNNSAINRIDPNGTFNFRNIVALAITAYVTYQIGFSIGVAATYAFGPTAGPIVGSMLGGLVGGLVGGEIAYRSNRLLGGSKQESSSLRKYGKIVGAIAGSYGGYKGSAYAKDEMTREYLQKHTIAENTQNHDRYMRNYEEQFQDDYSKALQDYNEGNLEGQYLDNIYDQYQNTIDQCLKTGPCGGSIYDPPVGFGS